MSEEAVTELSVVEQFKALAAEAGGIDDGILKIDAGEAKAETPAAKPGDGKTPDGKTPDGKPAIAAAVDGEKPAEEKKVDGAVTIEERVKFREEKRLAREKAAKAQEQIQAARQAIEQERAHVRAALAQAITPERARAMVEGGQLDELAKLMGHESWNALNDFAAKTFADPSYREIRRLQERDAQREAERAREKAEREEMQAAQYRAQQEAEFKSFITEELKASPDTAAKALVETEPELFTGAVYKKIADHYRRTGDQMDVAEAAEEVVAQARKRYAAWQKAFGGQPTTNQAEAAQAASPDRAGSKEQPARPTKHVARNRAAVPVASSGEMSHADFIKMGKEALEKSVDEDRANGVF